MGVHPAAAPTPGLDVQKLTDTLEALARSQAHLADQVAEMAVERRAERARRSAEEFAGCHQPSPAPAQAYSQEDMDTLKEQVSAVRRLVEEDRSTRAPATRGSGSAVVDSPVEPPGGGGDRGRGERVASAKARENSVAEDKEINELLQRCEKAGRSTADQWTQVLRSFRKIPPDEWGMPIDFKERLAPEVLSRIYVGNVRFAEEARRFLQEHGLEECLYARSLRDAAEAIDAAVLDDSIPDLINQVFLELLVRQAYAIMIGFQQCRCKSDWLKPKTNQGNWKSKVDFDIIMRINPRAGDVKRELVRGAENEIRASMQRDALWAKARQDHGASQTDILNS